MAGDEDITRLLREWSGGSATAGEALTPLVYDELHRAAARLFRRENAGHTLQPTALVHEAYAKLVNADVSWRDRAHFYALSARMMRRLLINYANQRLADKRGGDAARITLFDNVAAPDIDAALIDLTDALDELEHHDARKAQLIELQYFGGLSLEEIAEATNISTATVTRDLRFARAWLKEKLSESS
ncbi:MAG: ECF-type sigma factor [Parvularculaceae bacterium]